MRRLNGQLDGWAPDVERLDLEAALDVTLSAGPLTETAMDVVRGPLRRAGAPEGTTALVGGTSAVYADVADAVERDMRVILPVAALLIGLILVVALRSAVAPSISSEP